MRDKYRIAKCKVCGEDIRKGEYSESVWDSKMHPACYTQTMMKERPLRNYNMLPPLGTRFPKIILIDGQGKEWRYKGELLGGQIEDVGYTIELHIEAEDH